MSKFLKFEQCFPEKKVIDKPDILKTLFILKKNNLVIGELDVNKGWLTEDDVNKILTVQEDMQEKFGEIAVKEKYFSEEQLKELLGNSKTHIACSNFLFTEAGCIRSPTRKPFNSFGQDVKSC